MLSQLAIGRAASVAVHVLMDSAATVM